MSRHDRAVPQSVVSVVQSMQTTFAQLRWWSRTQWGIGAVTFAVALVALGEVGQTLPPSSIGRVYPIEWWNYVTLVADSTLMGLVAGSFISSAGRRLASASGGSFAAMVGAIMMACPVCSPLAIPLLGTGGVLAFLRGDRGWLALASIFPLGIALVLRLRASASCAVPNRQIAQTSAKATR